MLNFIFGRSGYGKTHFVFDKIEKIINQGQEDIILLTPEQFSFICERKLLQILGEKNINKVTPLSFSRLSNEIGRLYGWGEAPILSKGGKAILMKKAIDLSKGDFELFGKKTDSLNFVNSMISVYDEMRSCNLNSDEILNTSNTLKNGLLNRKLHDIAIMMNSYDKLIKGRFLDPTDVLSIVYEKLTSANYFKNKTVFIDGFSGFVAQEYKILEVILSQSKDVYITLGTDVNYTCEFYNHFAYVNDTAAILKKIADKRNLEYKSEILSTNHRNKNNELLQFEKNIFSLNKEVIDEKPQNIRLYSAKNVRDACEDISIQIKKLLRAGYRASEIAVVTRDLEQYKASLLTAFKKNDVPYFADERQPIKTQPIIVFAEYLMRCVTNSFRSDDLLSLAKTGLCGVSDDEISELENYVYLWNIDGDDWKKVFNRSTKGFVADIDEKDSKKLKQINITREKIVEPLLYFSAVRNRKTAREISEAVYHALKKFEADKNLVKIARDLNNSGKSVLAAQQGSTWDLLMEMLNQLAITLDDEIMPLNEFAKLFSLIISIEDLGELPAGLDNIQLGQADRMRFNNPKIVFVLGANEGEFPKALNTGGLLSENERQILANNDFKLYSFGEILTVQERYFAYMACSAPSEKLFITYMGNTGRESSPSEIVTELLNTFPSLKETKYEDILPIDKIESVSGAFELFASEYDNPDPFFATLNKYFENDTRYLAIQNLAENKDFELSDTNISNELFGKDMFLSASKIEEYYKCRFRYFCKFGLGAKPRQKAEINPMERGTLIHYVLEYILSNHGTKALSISSQEEIINLVDEAIKVYFKEEMGDLSNMSERFIYNFNRISKLIYSVILYIAEEFKTCDFEAKAFELPIDIDGAVKPQKIMLSDGGSIRIKGSIDRVDVFNKNNKQYVRVVDYKSGSKKFSLSDIINGLNLQMFVYLFSLCEDKNCKLSGTPAGVLYMHASRPLISIDMRSMFDKTISKEEQDLFKMKGIVLNDETNKIPEAMEHDLSGRFIPVCVNKSGSLTGSLATLEELGAIEEKVTSLIAEMGQSLHKGIISQNPVKSKNNKNTCEYCDFVSLCSIKKHIEPRVYDDLSDSKVKELLREGAHHEKLDTGTK